MNLAEMEEDFPVNYTLSDSVLEKIRKIRLERKDDIARSDPAWASLFGERTDEAASDSEEISESEEETKNDPAADDPPESQYPSTQFYFTQTEKAFCNALHQPSQKFDTIESLCEALERANGKLDFVQLASIADEQLPEVASNLGKKLSTTGLYNLLSSLAKASREEAVKYSETFCARVLLPKITELDEPSRLLSSAIAECTEKFPDDVQRLVFVPLLNADLKDTTAVNAIVNGFNSQRSPLLVAEYLQHAKELRHWHIPMLQTLLSFKVDTATKGKFVKLFLDEAARYASDKGFGKLVLSFIKVNGSFSEEQKDSLREIVNMHETLFRKLMENMLNKM